MSRLYLVQNQRRHYLSRKGEWLENLQDKSLFITAHHDEALNCLVEQSSKDVELRARVVTCRRSEEGRLKIAESDATRREEPTAPVDA